jgi:hypothetical protein
MVGMPYPNRSSPELQEKMAYLNSTQGSHAGLYYPSLLLIYVTMLPRNVHLESNVQNLKHYSEHIRIDRRPLSLWRNLLLENPYAY